MTFGQKIQNGCKAINTNFGQNKTSWKFSTNFPKLETFAKYTDVSSLLTKTQMSQDIWQCLIKTKPFICSMYEPASGRVSVYNHFCSQATFVFGLTFARSTGTILVFFAAGKGAWQWAWLRPRVRTRPCAQISYPLLRTYVCVLFSSGTLQPKSRVTRSGEFSPIGRSFGLYIYIRYWFTN
jgi:hypothetical protein